jgi:uncharacterized protein (DUF2141 family)
MIKRRNLCPLLLSLIGFSLLPCFANESGKITVHINNLRNNKGVVRIALFSSKKDFDKSVHSIDQEGNSFAKAAVPVKNQEAVFTFDDIPYGDYAIKFFHDEDNSGKFKTNLFGIPKVEYQYSNNPDTNMFGMAPYENAKFHFNNPDLNLIIEMMQSNSHPHSKIKIRSSVPNQK